MKARLQVIQLLLSESLGRPATASDLPAPRLPKTVAQVKEMSFEEMQYVFATIYAEEIEAVVHDGGEQALRDTVAELSEGERRVLREALAEAR